MAIQSYFFNAVLSDGVYDRLYNAEDVTSYLDLLVGNGVFPNPSTSLQVRANEGIVPGGGGAMDIIVGAGAGWINGHKMVNTSDLVMTVSDSDLVLNRVDAVIFYVDHDARSMGIDIKAGTLAEVPVSPAMTRNSRRYEMCLATIRVSKQTDQITDAMITDTRGNSALCGFVQGLLQQIDTTTLWQQQQAEFNEWMQSVKDQFASAKFFKKVEGIYTTEAANERVFNVQKYVPTYSYLYDILDVYIDGKYINNNEYVLGNYIVTLKKPIAEAGTVITFVVYKATAETESD